MIRARARRLGATVILGTLLAFQLFAGSASAAPPNWSMMVTPLPANVTPGTAAGFQVTISNNGNSSLSGNGNIASLYLFSDQTASPVYLSSSRPGTCGPEYPNAPSGALFCSFGALNVGDSVSIVVAYTTPTIGSTFVATFTANTTGVTSSDGPKSKSHGDSLSKTGTTGLSNNKNFAGFFSPSANGGIQNDANLSGNNKQSTGVGNLPAGIEATVMDGPGATGTCVSGGGINCNAMFGEWSEVAVNGGDPLPGGAYFIITIKFKTGTPTSFVHSFDAVDVDGNPYIAIEQIGACPGNAAPAAADIPCFTWNGVDTATIYTFHNGSYRGL